MLLAELKIQADKVEAFGRLIDRQAKDSVEREKDCHQFDVSKALGLALPPSLLNRADHVIQ